jgi:pimeloyl-ACP methyl ester carboxylesterase
MQRPDNPDGPLDDATATKLAASLTAHEDEFYDGFVTDFFSVGDELKVSEGERQEALAMCRQASKAAALESMTSFGHTDFRDDLRAVAVPALVIHGAGDKTVAYEGSGARTHPHSRAASSS